MGIKESSGWVCFVFAIGFALGGYEHLNLNDFFSNFSKRFSNPSPPGRPRG